MFDGIDHVVLPVAEIDGLSSLYTEVFGFTIIADESLTDPVWTQVWGLPSRPTRSRLLGKQGSRGGGIRLVQVPGLPLPAPARYPDRIGCFALDFYLRDPDDVEERLTTAGWHFRSEPVYYRLPGTDLPVRERMLENTHAGLLHALVQYRTRGTRCVLDIDRQAQTSEVCAMVFATRDIDAAKDFAIDVLGAQRYFDDRFDGPAVEKLLGLSPGEGFRGVLFRGPTSRNARLEFIEALPGSAAGDVVPRAVASIEVPDLSDLADRLADGRHGHTTGIVTATIDGAARARVGLRTVYGAHLELVQAAPGAQR